MDETVELKGPTTEQIRDFVLDTTVLRPAPAVPEIRLYLADDMTTLWQRSQPFFEQPRREPPYWASAWAGGQAVARYLLDRPATVAGLSVLDLATGSGLCAIAAARSGAARISASDIDLVSRLAVELNAGANGVVVDVLDGDLVLSAPPEVDVITAGDVCYEPGMAGAILSWLRECQAAGIRVLLGDPGRAYLPAGLVRLATYDIVGDPMLENAGVSSASVYALADPLP